MINAYLLLGIERPAQLSFSESRICIGLCLMFLSPNYSSEPNIPVLDSLASFNSGPINTDSTNPKPSLDLSTPDPKFLLPCAYSLNWVCCARPNQRLLVFPNLSNSLETERRQMYNGVTTHPTYLIAHHLPCCPQPPKFFISREKCRFLGFIPYSSTRLKPQQFNSRLWQKSNKKSKLKKSTMKLIRNQINSKEKMEEGVFRTSH